VTALALASAAAAALSLLLLAVNLAVFRPLAPAPSRREWPRVSVVIPARNEEREIEAALRAHRATDYPDVEVIVVDDRSTDGTGEIARRFAVEDRRFRVVAGGEPPTGWLGKPHALWEGAREASGEWLLFADADVSYAPDVLRRAVARAESGRLALLCILPRFVTRGFWEGVAIPNLYTMLYLGPGILTQIDAFRAFAGGSGSGNLVNRDSYVKSGGHAALRAAVIDDIGLAVQLKRAGFRTRAATAYDGVSVRIYRGLAEIVEGFSKNVAFIASPLLTLVLPLLIFGLTWAPYVVLAGPAGGGAKLLAGAALAGTLLGRTILSRVTRAPLWSGLFHPLMTTVWTAIALRSWHRRIFLREVRWRGRVTETPR
jgi:cellulose synthase/poly-beta-1,6-N-acetylglucosamine synthase-like glycosyltransferase